METIAVVGTVGLLMGAAVALLGGASYRLTPSDRTALVALGLRPDGLVHRGQLGSFDVVLDLAPGAVEIIVAGLPPDLAIEDSAEGPVWAGAVHATRSRKRKLAALAANLVGGAIMAEHRTLRLRIPTYIAKAGRLGEMVEMLAALLVDLETPVAWDEVAVDPREGLDLRLEALEVLAARGGTEAREVLGDRTDDPASAVRAVAHAVHGSYEPLETHCREEEAELVLPVLAFLPPERRATVVVGRLSTSAARAEPFAELLLRRIGLGEAPLEELRALAAELHDTLSTRNPLSFGGSRVETFEGALGPYAVVLEALGRAGEEVEQAWVDLAIELWDEIPGREADRFVEALKQVATIDDVAALRKLDSFWLKEVIEHLQEQAGGQRGALALAEASGGELAVVPSDEGEV